MYRIYSMGLKELAHSNFSLKSPLVIFVAIHELHNISHHQLNNFDNEWNAPSQNKIQPMKLNKEKRHNLKQITKKIYLWCLNLCSKSPFPLWSSYKCKSILLKAWNPNMSFIISQSFQTQHRFATLTTHEIPIVFHHFP
jgi:hypothetical protein